MFREVYKYLDGHSNAHEIKELLGCALNVMALSKDKDS